MRGNPDNAPIGLGCTIIGTLLVFVLLVIILILVAGCSPSRDRGWWPAKTVPVTPLPAPMPMGWMESQPLIVSGEVNEGRAVVAVPPRFYRYEWNPAPEDISNKSCDLGYIVLTNNDMRVPVTKWKPMLVTTSFFAEIIAPPPLFAVCIATNLRNHTATLMAK